MLGETGALVRGICGDLGLILAVLSTLRWRADNAASTGIADPQCALARRLTDTFARIHPAGVPAFVLAQFAGTLLATVFFCVAVQLSQG